MNFVLTISFLGKLKAQHFSSPSSRLVENNTSGSGGLGSSFTSGCLEKYLLSIIPTSLVGKIFTFHLTQTTLVLRSRWNIVTILLQIAETKTLKVSNHCHLYCQAQVQSPKVQIPVKGLGVTLKSHGPPT